MSAPARSGAPKRSLRSRKKQTTLHFSPLPSSSPGKDSYNHAVQERLVGARSQGLNDFSPHVDAPSSAARTLPTPEPSSDMQIPGEELAQHHRPTSSPSSPTRAQISAINLEEDSEDDVILSATKKRQSSSAMPYTELSSSLLPRRSRRLQFGSSSRPLYSSQDDATENQSLPSTKRSRRLRRRSQPRSVRSSQSESSHPVVSAEIPSPSHPRLGYSDLGSSESSDDDDAVMVTRPTVRRKSAATVRDPFIDNDDEIQYISDDEVHPTRTPKRRKDRWDDFIADDNEIEYLSSDDSDDHAQRERQPTKSRKLSSSHKSPRTPRRRTQEEQDELEEDLQDLKDSELETSATKRRTRGGPVTTQRDKAREHLNLLRRRRAGEKVPRVEDSEEEEPKEAEAVDIDLIGHPADEISSEGSMHSSIDTDEEPDPEQLQKDEDDFVIEDTNGRLGRPHPDIPLQFTSFASAKPRELFPHVIEWLVKNKIAPAFKREDELYNLAFDRLDAQVKAQAGSRLISAAWGTTFKRAILARPNMSVVALPGEDEDNLRTCDACNRTNHPARYEFVFSGEPYYKKTLEPVDNSDSDDEDVPDAASRDESGHILSSQTHHFYLGRFCAANAEMGHKLTHWKYHLNDNLISYLDSQGVLSPNAIVARDKMNKKRREKEAETIVDNMQETGVIGEFWAEFENDLNDARLGMEDYEKKGGRTKGRVGAIRGKSGGLVKEWAGGKVRVSRVESDSEGE